MNLVVIAKNLQGTEVQFQLDGIPDVCPICNRSVHPKNVVNQNLIERKIVQAVFRCTSQKCQELFIGTYQYSGNQDGRQVCRLNAVAPKSFKPHEFSESVRNVSPTFTQVFNQALSAEALGLTEIVGIGLRKSLEFFIKDFAIRQNTDAADKIKAMFLSKCIETFISDVNLKECARRATWLGNDETHYVRKWEDKDINDLKTLIRLTVNWIENVLLTEKYISSMTTT